MTRGVTLNLFEIELPSSPVSVMTKPWDNRTESLDKMRARLLPSLFYASEELGKLFVYGPLEENAEQLGFQRDEFDTQTDPRLTGRLVIDALVHHLVHNMNFNLRQRQYVAKVYEVTDVGQPLARVEQRLDVFPSYRVQILFLKVSNRLRFFLMANPKVRYQFVHSLAQIHDSQRVDLLGRFIAVACPTACDIFDCQLYSYKGRLAGKFMSVAATSPFECKFPGSGVQHARFITLDERSRFDFALPIEICELEASTSNINLVFAQRFSQVKASSIVSQLRVLTGELLQSGARAVVNTEVGRQRWNDISTFIEKIQASGIRLFDGQSIEINKEPVQAVEGGYTPTDFFFDQEVEHEEETESADDDNAF